MLGEEQKLRWIIAIAREKEAGYLPLIARWNQSILWSVSRVTSWQDSDGRGFSGTRHVIEESFATLAFVICLMPW